MLTKVVTPNEGMQLVQLHVATRNTGLECGAPLAKAIFFHAVGA